MMDIESDPIPLFEAADSDTLKEHFDMTPALVGAFALSPDEEPEISLSLFKTTMLLKNQKKDFFIIRLVFEVKLEIIYNESRDVTSPIIGFRLTSENKKYVSFYGSDAPQFAHLLGKVLNMRGFQQMFRPIRKLGRGNFATVYETERRTDKQKFAVKAFSKQNSYCAKNGRENLINELSLLRDLNVQPHPNVLRLEAVYESQNSIYVVLQLLEGKTLLETIQERQGSLLSDHEVKIVMNGLLNGIAHLCKNRVMHRDLKPQNIMIRSCSLQPVIVDFGLSTNVDLPQYLFFRCGTPGYVAPEIIKLTQSVHLEPTCDMFSLGAIFHVLLTNRPLFPGVKYDEVYRANKLFDYNFEGQNYKNISQSAIDLMNKSLILDPEQRITAEGALKHHYFDADREVQISSKKECSSLTTCGTPVDKKKKKKKFFFF